MITNQEKLFDLPAGKHYLNCAYMSPLARKVAAAGVKGILRKQHPWEIPPSEFFRASDDLRRAFNTLLQGGGGDHTNVCIIPSVSYGMATVARNLRPKRHARIITTAGQFPSNVYPWQQTGARVEQIAPPTDLRDRGRFWNERIQEAIRPGTLAVAIGHVHWADGTRFDLEAIRKETQRVGALLIVDGTQSIGAMPFDFKRMAPDALVCAGYKWLMGPYSIGLAWYGDYFKDGSPVEENWIAREGSEDFRTLTGYRSTYQPGMLRYDMGERSNFILVPMMLEALNMVNGWRALRIQEYCRHIASDALKRLRSTGWWVEDESNRGHHLFGLLAPPGQVAQDWQKALVRAGISVSYRGDFIRVSPHVYNSKTQLDRLAEVLTKSPSTRIRG